MNETDGPRPGSEPEAHAIVRTPREGAATSLDRVVPFSREREHHLPRSGEVAIELRTQHFHYPGDIDRAAIQALPDELVAAKAPFSEQAEEFRILRHRLLSSVLVGPTRPALAVLGAEGREGKSYLAANLAVSFSQYRGRTLLIDANLRRPRLHRLFNAPAAPGLADLLTGHVHGEPVSTIRGLNGLHFIGAGTATPADPAELLIGPRFSLLLDEMTDRFEHVIIDTPADTAGPDGRLIAARAGAALVVGWKGHSRVASMQRLLSSLGISPAALAGVVFNQH